MHPAICLSLFKESVDRLPCELTEAFGWIMHEASFPILDCEFTRSGRTSIRVKMDFSDWDDQPPSITLHNSSGELLQSLAPNSTGVFNSSQHPVTGRPFICMAGSKEFHTHPSHSKESWDQIRGKPGFDIGDILMKIWRAWLKGND